MIDVQHYAFGLSINNILKATAAIFSDNNLVVLFLSFLLIISLVCVQILDKEAVEKVQAEREIPDIKPGYIIQLKVVG